MQMVALQHKQRHHLVSLHALPARHLLLRVVQLIASCHIVLLHIQVQQYITEPAERKVEAVRAAAISPFMDRFYRNMDAYGRG